MQGCAKTSRADGRNSYNYVTCGWTEKAIPASFLRPVGIYKSLVDFVSDAVVDWQFFVNHIILVVVQRRGRAKTIHFMTYVLE